MAKCVRRTATLNQKFLHRSPADAWAWASPLVPLRRSPSLPWFTLIFMNLQLHLRSASYWILSPVFNDEVSMRHGKQEGSNSVLRLPLVSHATAALIRSVELNGRSFQLWVQISLHNLSLSCLTPPLPSCICCFFSLLFLQHILSVIIHHSGVMCSQPSLCWAICMTNRVGKAAY